MVQNPKCLWWIVKYSGFHLIQPRIEKCNVTIETLILLEGAVQIS